VPLTDQTIERLKHLVSEKLDMNIRIEDIDPGAPLLGDGLNLDSLALVELISLVEESFGIEFGEHDLNMESFASLRNHAAVIAARTPALV
jgi:acyl carrier protein